MSLTTVGQIPYGCIEPMNVVPHSLGNNFLEAGREWLKTLHSNECGGLSVHRDDIEFHVSSEIYREFAAMCDHQPRGKTVDGFRTYGLKGHPVIEANQLPDWNVIVMAPLHIMELSPDRGKEENRLL